MHYVRCQKDNEPIDDEILYTKGQFLLYFLIYFLYKIHNLNAHIVKQADRDSVLLIWAFNI